MAPDLPPDAEWLDRYLAGDGTADERTTWRRRIDADPELRDLVAGIERAAGHRASAAPPAWDVNAAWRAAVQAERRPAARVGSLRSTAWLGSRYRGALGWVAGIAAALLIGVVGTRGGRARLFGGTEHVREFSTAIGSRGTVTLRDGTVLMLGPSTHVRVASGFGAPARVIELDGEALFTVVHDPAHAFEVHTAHAILRDIGTTFAVDAYRGDAETRVAVAAGEVGLGSATLGARDVASIDTTGRVRVTHGVDVAPYVAWTQGGLAFADVRLGDVMRAVGRTYDLDIAVADTALDGALVTASFHGEPVEVVLDVVTRAVGAHYERHGREVVIRRGVVPATGVGAAGSATVRLTRAAGAL